MKDINRYIILTLLFILQIYQFTEGKVICFRKLKKNHKCAGIIRKVSFEDGEDCCSKRGVGFAIQKHKIGKNRFRCTPCSDLNKNPFGNKPPKLEPKKDILSQLPTATDRPKVQWGTWSPCSASCGAGWRSRYKVCDNCDRNDYENVQSRPCMVNFYCPVDGNWGPWFPWHPCSASCGGGTRLRQRKCNYPPPAYNGKNCEGLAEENNECNRKVCPVNGKWSDWSEFSPCSETCGQGMMRKTRRCDNPAPAGGGRQCSGQSVVNKKCEIAKCPQNGGWSLWSTWGPCKVTCGSGYRTRTRTCDSPPALYGGAECEGEAEELKECRVERACPVDGEWSPWTNYGYCRAAKCEKGYQLRSRSCDNPRPQHGGIPCDGTAFDRIECFNGQHCPVNGSWCRWNDWSVCSGPCESDDALQARQRECECPKPQHGGLDCEGKHLEVRKCPECETKTERPVLTAVIQLQASKPCSERLDGDDGEGISGFGDAECEESEEIEEETTLIKTNSP
ncbi:hypothetical protein SNE40_015357 [Patella caerulea]|uniref:Hemicentin-1 n=1 Tax=Patella caerulea TaxID=87958 RepID=A0AAN8JJS6_PATCE